MAKATLHLWHSLTQYYSSYQKYHLTKMAPHKNGILQNWHLKTYIIGFLKYYQHPANRTYP